MANLPLVFKTSKYAWVYDGDANTLTPISDAKYVTGDSVTIAGANETAYNGTFTITTTSDNTFTYPVAGSPPSPATGAITASKAGFVTSVVTSITSSGGVATVTLKSVGYPGTTVPGIIYIDGTYYVMDSTGTIYGSSLEDPYYWPALNFIQAEVEPDGGIYLAKYLNYALALGEWTTEFFEDVGNTTGSPLGRIDNTFLQIGCASGRSVVETDNGLVWIAHEKENDRGHSAGKYIVLADGLKTRKISTPQIDRFITADPLTTVYSYALRSAGHIFYLLSLVASNITLVCDLTDPQQPFWYQWSEMVIQVPKSVTALTLGTDGTTATASVTAHGYSDGDVVTIAGATQTAYNGTYNITYIDANTFTYQVTGIPVTPATGTITATGYTEQYIQQTNLAVLNNINYAQHISNGYVYQVSDTQLSDNGAYINFLIRTVPIDLETNEYKAITDIAVIGDKVSGNVLIRLSKDDYTTFTTYRSANMSLRNTHLTRFGRARRFSVDLRITDAVQVRLERLDITTNDNQ